ncbi:DNA-3-methyladenine glycosylase I [Spiroplasma turonicum]|uniref:DNA-3-methyladenine glycosidase I n=1 Tax=Spiroplasma turonicum TaxID=216946 RepID=A0A0K1P7Z1_9MOLU|nr:DNA-3-methyladenine glycosylase I [Spiroplasma turonicum]AKU79987.1 DNA-3-methyladenine glycosidase I [Spiroplasma turonicum]ALX70989.1 DNA-3-methyladenine glycosidase I [Spiroplasma turonicum]
MKRCNWSNISQKMTNYHDNEWGVLKNDDTKFFEIFCLEIMQSGLSWEIILNKREYLKEAFDNFDFNIISNYKENKISTLMENKNIIRNNLKILAIINNANKFIDLLKEYNNFNNFLNKYIDNYPIINNYKFENEIPSYNDLSIKLVKVLKNKGFKFIGPTIMYSFLQASGIINDHISKCDFKYIN